MKSPTTIVITKIEPIMIPERLKGMMMLVMICQADAPESLAASIRDLSIFAIELKIGTTMNKV